MSNSRNSDMDLRSQQASKVWVQPTLRYLGDVKDLVRGGGKTGPNSDSDPQNTRKLGTG